MPRAKSLTVAAINITIQPPNPESYVQFWELLYAQRHAVKVRGDQRVMIGQLEPIEPNNKLNGFRGFFYRFTFIDLTKPWLDLTSNAEADDSVIKKEVRIPDFLKPNLSTFAYVFFPRQHRLVFETNSSDNGNLAVSSIERLILALKSAPSVLKVFPTSECTIEQDRNNIEDIVHESRLNRLVITVKKPNPDGASKKMATDVFAEFDREGLQEKTLALKAPAGGHISPNAETLKLAKVAASNGSVKAVAKDANGKTKNLSSLEKPLTETTQYNNNQVPLLDHFERQATVFVEKLLGTEDEAAPSDNPPII